MNFPILTCLRQIHEHLGPTLAELGLKAKVGTISMVDEYRVPVDYDRSLTISFVSPDGDYFSPVEIDLFRQGGGQPSRSVLDGATIRTFEWLEENIGSNEWLLVTNPRYYEETLTGDQADIFAAIGRQLKRFATVPFIKSLDGVSTDMDFGKLYHQIVNQRMAFKNERLDCDRENGFEGVSFRYWSDDSSWRVALENGAAVIYLENERIDTCAVRDLDTRLNGKRCFPPT